MRKQHLIIPQEETGYVLNPEHSFFAVVIPEDTVNLVANPECYDTTGYSGMSATLASSAAQQRRGARSLLVTPTAGSGGVRYNMTANLATGKHYTFSVDILGAGRFAIYFGDSNGGRLGPQESFVVPNFWNRYSITFFVPSGAAVRSLVVMALDGTPFYADGFQCENLPFATTFVSGNLEAQTDTSAPGRLAYGWMGTTHRSSSFRTRFVLDGGRPMPMHELGFSVTDFSGFGYAVPELFVQRLAMRADWVYQGASLAERQFTIGGYFSSGGIVELLRKRGQLGAGIHGTEGTISPVVIQMQLHDENGPLSELAQVECLYAGGMEGVINNLYQEKAIITFRCLRPFVRLDGNRAVALETSKTTADSPILVMYPDGLRDAVAGGAYSWSDDGLPFRMAIAKDGSVYVTNGGYLLRHTRSGWSQIDNVANALMRDVCTGPDGKIYYIYEDDEDGSQYGHLRRYNPTSGSIELNSGGGVRFHTSFSGTDIIMSRVRADPYNNRLYVCGNYGGMEVSGSAPPEAGARGFDGVAYLDLNTGTWVGFPRLSDNDERDYCVYDVAPATGNICMMVGDFMSSMREGVNGPWSWAIFNETGTYSGGATALIRYAAEGVDDTTSPSTLRPRNCVYDRKRSCFYVGGDFDAYQYKNNDVDPRMVYSTGEGICSIDQLSMLVDRMGFGVEYKGLPTPAFVTDLIISPDGKYLYVTGAFDSAVTTHYNLPSNPPPSELSYISAPGFAVWDIDARAWVASDVVMPGAGAYTRFGSSLAISGGTELTNAYNAVSPSGYTEWYGDLASDAIASTANAIYVSHTDQESTYESPVTVVSIPRGARIVPRLEVRGPAKINKVINATTGRIMNPGLTANAGESIVFSFAPGPVWVRSTTRALEYPNLGKDSWPDLGLVSGDNNIILDVDVSGGGDVSLYWYEEYASVDALVVRDDKR